MYSYVFLPPFSIPTVGYKKKKSVTTHNNINNNNNKQVSLPKIPGTQGAGGGGGGSPLAGSPGRGLDGGIGGRVKQGEPVGLRNYDPKNPLTVELQHGQARQQIVLPTDLLDKSKKYHLTFTIKPSSPKIKEQQQHSVDTDHTTEHSSSVTELPAENAAPPATTTMDSLPSDAQEPRSAIMEARTDA
ncbi:hypothetical protein GWK47_040542 [Chionoecetes opilio]|uniref:Uncharacterized protein n=1 Tax=Chionoecetes opilio TaxID=41210 RepID=A0A8J5CXA3_CHIOP|nr:hypothetical protein GWK47_040542 [Chionoecetes opilio]